MFVCTPCLEKHYKNDPRPSSCGPCEVCKVPSECSDIPSKYLIGKDDPPPNNLPIHTGTWLIEPEKAARYYVGGAEHLAALVLEKHMHSGWSACANNIDGKRVLDATITVTGLVGRDLGIAMCDLFLGHEPLHAYHVTCGKEHKLVRAKTSAEAHPIAFLDRKKSKAQPTTAYRARSNEIRAFIQRATETKS